jgi:HK97 family phage major capsid protein
VCAERFTTSRIEQAIEKKVGLMKCRYPFLLATLTVLALVLSLFFVGAILFGGMLALIVLFQLGLFCLDGRRPALFTTMLTQRQIDEFSGILEGVKSYDGLFKSLPDRLKNIEQDNEQLRSQLKTLRKAGLAGSGSGVQWLNAPGGAVPVVTQDCAEYVGSMFVIHAAQQNKLRGSGAEAMVARAAGVMGMEVRAAVATTDIPMPVQYAQQIVELVYTYGTARKVSTVYPLGTASVKLPRLKTGEPTFGFINMSAAVPEKVPQMEFVTFTPGKCGGIVRIPSEIDADSIVAVGQFVARYIAREMAKLEDTCFFLGDGTSTYNSIQGVGKQSTTDGNVLQLTATNSSSDKITLANCRTLRTLPTAAVLNTAAYYAHPSFDALFVSFNTSATVVPYQRKSDGSATLDGFPIVWVPIMPVYSTSATLNAYQIYFGDLKWWYFGERLTLSVETSRDVYFATDEVGIRALERFDIHAMGQLCSAALQLSAS